MMIRGRLGGMCRRHDTQQEPEEVRDVRRITG